MTCFCPFLFLFSQKFVHPLTDALFTTRLLCSFDDGNNGVGRSQRFSLLSCVCESKMWKRRHSPARSLAPTHSHTKRRINETEGKTSEWLNAQRARGRERKKEVEICVKLGLERASTPPDQSNERTRSYLRRNFSQILSFFLELLSSPLTWRNLILIEYSLFRDGDVWIIVTKTHVRPQRFY